MKTQMISAFTGLSLSLVALSSQAAPTCADTLEKLEAKGLSTQALAAFNKELKETGKLSKVAGKKKVAIVDLSKKRSEDRFFILNLETGEIEKSFKTTHGVGNKHKKDGSVVEIGKQMRGKRMAPAGLMEIADHPRGVISASQRGDIGFDLVGLDSDNKNVKGSGIMIQSCRHMELGSSNSRSYGSFCLKKDEIKRSARDLRDSVLFSVRPQESRQSLSAEAKQDVCGLFPNQSLRKAELEPYFEPTSAQATRFETNDMNEPVAPGSPNGLEMESLQGIE